MLLLLGFLHSQVFNEPSVGLMWAQVISLLISYMMFMTEVIHIISRQATVGRWWPTDGQRW